jgi:hypothetical protein
MTKSQRRSKAKRAGARRRKMNAAVTAWRKLNPGKKLPDAVRIKRLGGGGFSIIPMKMNKAGGFERCVRDVTRKGSAYDPRAVCATAGRKKYGQAEMTRRSIAGKRRARRMR